jgi:hypothetical protein
MIKLNRIRSPPNLRTLIYPKLYSKVPSSIRRRRSRIQQPRQRLAQRLGQRRNYDATVILAAFGTYKVILILMPSAKTTGTTKL